MITFSEKTREVLYWGALLFIVCLSFLYYAPCNYGLYNSDHAIHVLMAQDFQLPRDFYYWGQNRLGSLLPMVAHYLGKVIPLHPLYVCSIVQYLFLGTGFFVLASAIRNKLLKIALAALIFLPVNEYNALILIGHPYASQLFAGALFILFLSKLRKYLLQYPLANAKEFLIASTLLIGALLFFLIGIWASEFSAILAVIPILYLLFEKELRVRIVQQLKSVWLILLLGVSLSGLAGAGLIYKTIKRTASLKDDVYEKQFIDNGKDLAKSFGFFADKLKTSLLFRDTLRLENFFNWVLIILAGIMIVAFLRKQRVNKETAFQINSLILTSFLACVLLFLSTWNLRSSFSPRYFTPVYVLFCFLLLLFFDNTRFKRWLISIIGIYFTINGVAYAYASVIREHQPGPFKQYSEFQKLPKGTLIGDYWDVYRINSIAAMNLESIPYEYQTVRNWAWRDSVMHNQNFYFLDKWPWPPGGLRDTLIQFRYMLKATGKRYTCNHTDVLEYRKLEPLPLMDFALKASNGCYVITDPQSKILLAAGMDSSKAETFHLVQTYVGVALKTSSGKFVCADLGENAKLIARSNDPWDWEIFKLIATGRSTFGFIATNGLYVSADYGIGGALIANRDKVLEWESFFLERR